MGTKEYAIHRFLSGQSPLPPTSAGSRPRLHCAAEVHMRRYPIYYSWPVSYNRGCNTCTWAVESWWIFNVLQVLVADAFIPCKTNMFSFFYGNKLSGLQCTLLSMIWMISFSFPLRLHADPDSRQTHNFFDIFHHWRAMTIEKWSDIRDPPPPTPVGAKRQLRWLPLIFSATATCGGARPIGDCVCTAVMPFRAAVYGS